MMCQQYDDFDYDEAVIGEVVRILSAYESALMEYKVSIRCDDVITWICFTQEEESLSASQIISESSPSVTEKD